MEKDLNILTVNPGSTSIKVSLFKGDVEVFRGHFKKTERRFTFNGKKIRRKDFENSVTYVFDLLKKRKLIKSPAQITRFGVRVVHGGELFRQTTRLTKLRLRKLRRLSPLAPLHNPPALSVIDQIIALKPGAEIHCVFDTAFHQSLPQVASTYALPRGLSERLKIEKYGFHGIACEWNLHEVKKSLGRTPKRIIICHLGGGCSVTAVKNGKSVDTSMGFTPLEGLIMVSRSGDLDPGLIGYLADRLKKSTDQVIELLNHRSGIYGLTGTKDVKMVVERAKKGNPECRLAVEMFVYRLVKYIYAYYGVLQGLDLLVFSGGIGEGSEYIRSKVFSQLKLTGLKKTQIMVVHTDENKEIFRQLSSMS